MCRHKIKTSTPPKSMEGVENKGDDSPQRQEEAVTGVGADDLPAIAQKEAVVNEEDYAASSTKITVQEHSENEIREEKRGGNVEHDSEKQERKAESDEQRTTEKQVAETVIDNDTVITVLRDDAEEPADTSPPCSGDSVDNALQDTEEEEGREPKGKVLIWVPAPKPQSASDLVLSTSPPGSAVQGATPSPPSNNTAQAEKSIKIVAVGDGSCGAKTSLLKVK